MSLTWDDAKGMGNLIRNLCNKVNGHFYENVDDEKREASYVCVLSEPHPIVVDASRHYLPESKDAFYEVRLMIKEKGAGIFGEAVEDFAIINIGSVDIDVLNPNEANIHVEKKEPETQVRKTNGTVIKFYHNDRVALSRLIVE